MGTRLDKFRTLNGMAGRLGLTPANRCRLLASDYLQRIRTRAPFLPLVRLNLSFQFEGRPVSLTLRSNGVDCNLLSGVFDLREYQVPGAHPRRILDLGGNIGVASVFFHAAHPEAEIVAVEALPANVPLLQENFRINGISGRVMGAAVADQPGKATLFLGQADNSSFVRQPWMSGDAVEVDCFTVPEILLAAGWDEIDLLKVDIEGAERALFRDCGAWIGKVGALVAELHDGYSIEEFDRDTLRLFQCSQVFEKGPTGNLKGVVAIRKTAAG